MNTSIKTLLAVVAVAMAGVGCNTTPTQDGALLGGALGAGAGAIIGNQVHGQSGEGALIGAAAGALAGALIGDKVDDNRQRNQRVYQEPAPATTAPRAQEGHYETRIVVTQSGERYEERVWVPHN